MAGFHWHNGRVVVPVVVMVVVWCEQTKDDQLRRRTLKSYCKMSGHCADAKADHLVRDTSADCFAHFNVTAWLKSLTIHHNPQIRKPHADHVRPPCSQLPKLAAVNDSALHANQATKHSQLKLRGNTRLDARRQVNNGIAESLLSDFDEIREKNNNIHARLVLKAASPEAACVKLPPLPMDWQVQSRAAIKSANRTINFIGKLPPLIASSTMTGSAFFGEENCTSWLHTWPSTTSPDWSHEQEDEEEEAMIKPENWAIVTRGPTRSNVQQQLHLWSDLHQDEEDDHDAIYVGKVAITTIGQSNKSFQTVAKNVKVDDGQAVEEMANSVMAERHWQSAAGRDSLFGVNVARPKTAHPLCSLDGFQQQLVIGSDEIEEEIVEEIDDLLDEIHIENYSDDDFFSTSLKNGLHDDYNKDSPITELPDETGADGASLGGAFYQDHSQMLFSANNNADDVSVSGSKNLLQPAHAQHSFKKEVDETDILLPNCVTEEQPCYYGDLLMERQSANCSPIASSSTDNLTKVKLTRRLSSKASRSMPSLRKPTDQVCKSKLRNGSSRTSSSSTTSTTATGADPKSAIQSALKKISSADWEAKLEGIRAIVQLSGVHSEALQVEMHVINLALLEEMRNLRSQVSRAAIQAVSQLFQNCSKSMEQDLDRIVCVLLHKSADTNRFIREDSHATLIAMTQSMPPTKAIVAVLNEGLCHKNAIVRAEAAKLLAAIVTKMGSAKALSGAKDTTERILPAAAQFLQESNPEARSQARNIFSLLVQEAVFDKAAHKYLTATTVRTLRKTLDSLKKSAQSNFPSRTTPKITRLH